MAKKKNAPKQPKRKPKYKWTSSFAWMMRKLWRHSKRIAFAAVAVIPLAIVLYAINLYLIPTVLKLFEDRRDFGVIVLTMAALIFTQLVFRLLKDLIDRKREVMDELFHSIMRVEMFEHDSDLDRYLWLYPENQEKENRGWHAVNGDGYRFPATFANMIVNVLCFILFGSVISTLSPIIVLVLVACSLIIYAARQYKKNKDYQGAAKRDLVDKKLNYISFVIARNMYFGKDIRLFGMNDFIDRRTEQLIDEHTKNYTELQNTQTMVTTVTNLVSMLRDGAAYGILLYRALNGSMTVAEFSLYFSAISQLSGFFTGIVGEIASLGTGALQVSDLREYFDLKGKLRREGGIKPNKGVPLSIEFKNVSYKYPEGEKQVLKNVSFRIEPGEKIALVGVNGAGKTTLVRLMCGLLIPDEGEVLLDGHSIFDYNRDEMYELFSFVPQDFRLLPSSIAENITISHEDERDNERMQRCIDMAGLREKVDSLPDGADTPLENRYNPKGVKLSGGETQKLLLARALYRSAEIMILDEPTAALDPIAEDEMYRKYTENTKNCTSIFISHRLASTRFCDRIFLLDGMDLAEVGTHEELMKRGGKYKEMFDVQSEYYK